MSETPKKITCVKHGKDISTGNFYISGADSKFSGIGFIPICKACIYKEVEKYSKTYEDLKYVIYLVCRKIDVGFDSNIFEGALKNEPETTVKVFMNYMTQYNSLGIKNGNMLPFDEGEHIGGELSYSSSETECFEEGRQSVDDAENTIELTKDDRENKKEVIDILEYDPFYGFSEQDQKFLYSDLINYFADEDIREDQFLVSQIIQVVNNNNQIRKLDYLLSQYMSSDKKLTENQSAVKSLNSTKKDIVANNDKIAKENRISVKSRQGSNISKSSLTVMMERLRLLDFEDAEIDYYDQKKGYGMKRAADISMKAMFDQMQFDENSINEVIVEQRNMIRTMETKILDLEEENRLLHIKVSENKGVKFNAR